MKIKRTNLSPARVKLDITLEPSEIASAEQVALVKLAKTVKVAGFRQGHAPASIAAKHVDPQELAESTVDNAISKAVAEAFVKENIRVLERPEVELTKFVPGSVVEFSAVADMVPEIKLGDYKKLEIKSPAKVSVKKADIDEVIERLRNQLATKSAVDRAAKNGDVVLLDFVGKKDSVAFDGGSADDYELELGSGSFIPGFEEGLVGKKAGEHVDLKLKFPTEYGVADLAGADVVFATDVKEVREKALPARDDEFAKKTGAFKTLEELENDIKQHLTADAEQKNHDELRDAVVAKLVEVSDIPAPETLVNDQIAQIERDALQNLQYQGRGLDDYLKARGLKDREAWLKDEVEPLAKQRVQAGLALSEVSQKENITVGSADVDKQIADLRSTYAKEAGMLKQLESDAVRQDLENRLVTEKTIDFLLKQVK